MSNCLKIPPVEVDLAPILVDDSIKETQDVDGNTIKETRTELLFIPAELTTWRDLAIFVAKNIAPFVEQGMAVDIPNVYDESDGFTKPFTLTIRYEQDPSKVL